MRCVLIGNYGVGNIGDEALRQYFLGAFPEVTWTVVSAAPQRMGEVPRLPLGLRSCFRAWWKTIIAFCLSDAVVFGGGTLFTDSESVFACVLWGMHALVARVFGLQIVLAFQGVGPFRTRFAECLTKCIFEQASFVSVRDAASLERVRKWALQCEPIESFDPAFAVFAPYRAPAPVARTLVIIPRGNSDEEFCAPVRGEISKPWDAIHILLMQPDKKERQVAVKISALCGGKSTIIEIDSVTQLLAQVSQASMVVTQRYHGALAALAMKKPVMIVPQIKDDKLEQLRMEASDPQSMENFLQKVRVGEEELGKILVTE